MQSAFDDLIPKRQPGGVPGVVIGSHPAPARQQYEGPLAAADLAAKNQEAAARTQEAELRALQIKKAKDEAAANATVSVSSKVHGDQYLSSLPPDITGVVKKIASGDLAPPQGAALRTPYWQQMMQHVINYDPEFAGFDYATRAKERADYATGKMGVNITALNTALGHAGEVVRDSQALGNSGGFLGTSIVNPIRNWARGKSGDPRTTNFDNDTRAFGSELAKVFSGSSGGSAGERNDWETSVPVNGSPEQQMGVLQHDALLLKSRLDALNDQYKRGMGHTSDITDLLNPHAREVYQQLLGMPGASAGGAMPPGSPPSSPPGGLGGPSMPPAPGPAGPAGPTADKSTKYYGNGQGGPDQIAIPLSMRGESLQKDPVLMGAAKHLAAMLADRKISDADIMAYAQSLNANPASVEANLKFRRDNPTYTGGYNTGSLGFKNVPLTATQWIGNNIGTSPVGTAAITAANAVSAGSLANATANPDETRALIQGVRDMNPKSALAGDVVGGGLAVGGLEAGAGGLATRAGLGAKALPWATRGADAAYGAVSGANGDPNDPLTGAAFGGLTGVLGGMGGRAAGRGLSAVLSPSGGEMAPLYAQGVFPTVGQRFGRTGWLGKAVNTGEQALQSVPALGSLVARARNIPRDQFQIGAFNSALRDIGEQLPAGIKPGTEPHTFAAEKFNQAYDNARSGMQFVPDQQFATDLAGFHQGLGNGILTEPAAAQVKKVIQTAVGSRLPANGVMTGDVYKAAASDLSRAAVAWSKDPATSGQANALNDFISIFDQTARRGSAPEASAALDAADKGYAKLVRIQQASAARGGEAGTFSPTQFDRSVQTNSGGVRSSAYNRGDALMQDYATAGKGLVDTLPNSGTADRLLTGQAVGGLTGGGAAAAGVPIAAMAKAAPIFAPYLPGANFLTTRALAPNAQRLPGALGAMLDTSGNYVNDRAAIVGKLALPALLAWQQGQ